MELKAMAPATCGELVQGIINNTNLHITCPINIYSEATFEGDNTLESFEISPSYKRKAYKAVKQTLIWANYIKPIQGKIQIKSSIPSEKGMASSTADIAACSLLTAKLVNKNITGKDIAKISLTIEPTDGLFYEDIVAFDHVKGMFFERIGKAIPLNILVFDFGGQVNTVDFNSRQDLQEKNLIKEPQIKKAYNFVVRGIKNRDPRLIGEGATISSLANQEILFKPGLEEIIKLIIMEKGLGVNIAHSGTIAGILLSPEYNINKTEKLRKKILDEFPYLEYIGYYQLTNGGVI